MLFAVAELLVVSALETQTRVVTNTELCARLLSGSKRHRIDTLTQCAAWSQCAVDSLFHNSDLW